MSCKEIKRVPIRVSSEIYKKIKRAADLSGVPLNSFLIMTMNKQCDDILQQHFFSQFDQRKDADVGVWKVKDIGTASWLAHQLNSPCQSNLKLKQAYKEYQVLQHT